MFVCASFLSWENSQIVKADGSLDFAAHCNCMVYNNNRKMLSNSLTVSYLRQHCAVTIFTLKSNKTGTKHSLQTLGSEHQFLLSHSLLWTFSFLLVSSRIISWINTTKSNKIDRENNLGSVWAIFMPGNQNTTHSLFKALSTGSSTAIVHDHDTQEYVIKTNDKTQKLNKISIVLLI